MGISHYFLKIYRTNSKSICQDNNKNNMFKINKQSSKKYNKYNKKNKNPHYNTLTGNKHLQCNKV